MSEPAANMKPRIVVIGVGGAGGNAVNNMIAAGLSDAQFIVANTDVQALALSRAETRIQLGTHLTEGLGAGSNPQVGEAAAEEAYEAICNVIAGAHIVFITAGMGGGTGTGAAYVIARAAKDFGILTVAVVTKPFQFEGTHRLRNAEAGIAELRKHVDTLLVIPNENLFRVANDRTTFAEAFVLADQVLYSGIASIIDLIVKEGLINLDLADVKTVLSGMGAAMMGMGEASGDQRALIAAEEAIVNPLLDDGMLKGARSLLLSITGGRDLTLWEVEEAANRVRQEVDADANIIVGATLDEAVGDKVRVSIVASGIPQPFLLPSYAEGEAPGWTPRSHVAPSNPAPAERFGRHLTEAISERDPQAKGRASRGRAKERRAAGETDVKKEVRPKLPRQPPMPRQRKGSSSRKAAAATAPAFQQLANDTLAAASERRERHQPPAEGAAAVGWPEQWASTGETSERAEARETAPALQRQPAPDPPRTTLLRRLAGLVGTRRDA
jgi:cell division protein FtsZ